jgi:hypothetical protein
MVQICSACHGPEVVTSTRMDHAGWDGLVRDMIDRGGTASEQQIRDTVDYLSRTFPAGR